MILEISEKQGFVSYKYLVDHVGVSESTIRRDLEYLDVIGKIRRTRGGAAFIGESLRAFEDRRTTALAEKRRIGRAVAEMIEPGEAILLDGGTTTLEVARELVGRPIQVVTNSLPIVKLLWNEPKIELLVIGGFLYPKTGVALGPLAVAGLKQIHVRRLIMSVGGITQDGLFNSNALLVETEREMMSAAEEVIVVSDSSKFGHAALARLCSLEDVDRLVSDEGISPEWRQILTSRGVELTVATREDENQLP